MQWVEAGRFRGCRVRLGAALSAQGVSRWCGLWLRIDLDGKGPILDNMASSGRAVSGTIAWARHHCVLDVPTDALALAFGAILHGAGTVRVADFDLAAVDASVAVTSDGEARPSGLLDEPVNLDCTG